MMSIFLMKKNDNHLRNSEREYTRDNDVDYLGKKSKKDGNLESSDFLREELGNNNKINKTNICDDLDRRKIIDTGKNGSGIDKNITAKYDFYDEPRKFLSLGRVSCPTYADLVTFNERSEYDMNSEYKSFYEHGNYKNFDKSLDKNYNHDKDSKYSMIKNLDYKNNNYKQIDCRSADFTNHDYNNDYKTPEIRSLLYKNNDYSTDLHNEFNNDFVSDYRNEFKNDFKNEFVNDCKNEYVGDKKPDYNHDYAYEYANDFPNDYTTEYSNEFKNDIKNVWKKERNRLAAKKSREKKAFHLKQLENRERILENNIKVLKEAVTDYDNILREMLIYLDTMRDVKGSESVVQLFDCLCRLKKCDGGYFEDVGYLLDKPLSVSNKNLDDVAKKIKKYLNEMIYKFSG